MFLKILVPVDLTDKNRLAVEQARDLLETGGEILLLHVIETIDDVPFEELEDFYHRLETRAQDGLGKLAELAGDEGSVRRQVVYGKRVREIVDCAAEEAVDLIVLSSHPVGPEHAAEGWATLSYQVAILARCPVLLVK